VRNDDLLKSNLMLSYLPVQNVIEAALRLAMVLDVLVASLTVPLRVGSLSRSAAVAATAIVAVSPLVPELD
jgi:hypothetical protein